MRCATPTRSTTCACRSSCTASARSRATSTPAPSTCRSYSHGRPRLRTPTASWRPFSIGKPMSSRTYESIPARDVAFLGLGVMGFPMAGHLAAAGHRVTVYNRTATKASEWVTKHGGKSAQTPAQAAKGADFVFACVGNDDDLRSIALGADGAFAGMRTGAVFVDL